MHAQALETAAATVAAADAAANAAHDEGSSGSTALPEPLPVNVVAREQGSWLVGGGQGDSASESSSL